MIILYGNACKSNAKSTVQKVNLKFLKIHFHVQLKESPFLKGRRPCWISLTSPCQLRYNFLKILSSFFLFCQFVTIWWCQRGNQCAQIWYRRSHNYRSTSCPWEASRERRWRALPFFLPRRSCTRERLVPLLLILLASSMQCYF